MTRVLIATVMGAYDHGRTLDMALLQALGVRGAEVEVLLCDKAVPCCQMIKMGRSAPDALARGDAIPYCEKCVLTGRKAYEPLGRPLRWMSQSITAAEKVEAREIAAVVPLADIRSFRKDGFTVGEHAFAGALRYFARGDLDGEPQGEAVLRRYLEAGLLSIVSLRRLLSENRFDVIVVNHGIYIPQGMIAEVARSLGVRVVTYNPAYRKHCFIFSHAESYHFTMLSEPTDTWRGLDLTDRIRTDTDRYLASRRTGANDWIWFHDQPREEIAPVLSEIGADPARPFVTLLTSVVWDAQLHYRDNAFPSLIDWLVETVEYWGRRTDDLQLVIRVHPAEVRGMVPSRQRAVDELMKRVPVLPPNVFVIGPDNQASTYALSENSNAVVVYNTKTGIEVSAMGVPVIVAGEAWVRGKGFTEDASDRAGYFAILDRLPRQSGLAPAERDLAYRYAYHFFFRRMIPLPFIEQVEAARFAIRIDGPGDLAPGRWPGLDVICDGILEGTPFIYPAETLAEPFGPAPQAAQVPA